MANKVLTISILVMRKMQIKTALKFPIIAFRIVMLKPIENGNKVLVRMWRRKNRNIVWWKEILVQPLENNMKVLQKFKIGIII